MTQTNIEYFNSTFKLFINNILTIFPEYKDDITDYYSELLNNDTCNDDKYIKRYMRKMDDFKIMISKKNDELFQTDIYIFKNINFKDIWNSELCNEKTKNTIWDYLQTLFVIGETIISDSTKIKSLVENFKKIRDENSNENSNEHGNETSNDTKDSSGINCGENSDTDNISENDTEDNEIYNMLKNLSENAKQNESNNSLFNEDFLNNGIIGNLAKELSQDINLDEMGLNLDLNGKEGEEPNINDIFGNLMGGGNPMKFMNLIQNVGNKIQNKLQSEDIDQEALVSEAQNMMGMLSNNNPLLDNLLKSTKQEMAAHKNEQTSNNPTKERLRKKLEQRKQNKK